jgi:hypothetical protein
MATDFHAASVVVCGDVTMDWNLARTRRADGGGVVWNADDSARAYWQRGGAAMLADLIEAIAVGLHPLGTARCVVHQMEAPRAPVLVGDERYHHSYAAWAAFPYGGRAPRDHDEKPAWRVEEFMGLHCGSDVERGDTRWKQVVGDTPAADVVVLDDAALGFRNHRSLWPQAITTEGRRPWVVVKMARPVAQGPLWEHLQARLADRVVVVMTINDLRLSEVQVSREHSWERTAQDLAWELVHNPRVNGLSRCAHVVVSFDTAGAVLLSQGTDHDGTAAEKPRPQCRLFFDPKLLEGGWREAHPGGMIGNTSCLAGGMVREILLAPTAPNIARGIQRGLAAMRTLHLEGYGVRGSTAGAAQLTFPAARVAEELAKEGAPFAKAAVRDPLRALTAAASGAAPAATKLWTILEDQYTDTLDKVAEQIVFRGADVALQGVPLGEFGGLLTVDRAEIESFRSIGALIREYCSKPRQKRPLSIAVFGAPGSGKSFGITEVAKTLLPGRVQVCDYNLSQFNAPEQLHDALHQVRDVALGGFIPLVFWDEFDTRLGGQALGWLRYFLAPMQDGRFQHGQITHTIGRAIFVFAGGVTQAIEDFGLGLEGFEQAKGRDFASRLKGYINILGPNRRSPSGAGEARMDRFYVVRRAILLRSILLRDAPQLFDQVGKTKTLNIDSGVLRALLYVPTYKHGVRSMESIVAMSILAGKRRFERSSLPAVDQLALHVDAREFQALVQKLELDGELLEKLAAAAHAVFCAGKTRDGWTYGPVRDDAKKIHPLLVPFEELPETYKDANRVTVRTIPTKLAAAGYVMIPARSNDPPWQFPGEDLERLARLEHELWMADKLAAGFTLGPPTPEEPKRSEYLVPWDDVPEPIKEIDRDLIRGIPTILAEAGYTIVRLQSDTVAPPRIVRTGQPLP